MNIVMLLKPKSEVAYIREESTLRQGLEKMKAHGYSALPVLNKHGEYTGTVSEGDFLWDLLKTDSKTMKDGEKYTVAGIMRSGFNPAVTIDTTMDDLLVRVMDSNFVPVVDDRNVFMGIITRRDVIKYFRTVKIFNESLLSMASVQV